MKSASTYQAIVEKLYTLFKKNGFLTEDEALSVINSEGISLVGINRVIDQLISLGVIFTDDTILVDSDDRAQTDYESLYREVLEISPGQQILIDYIENIQPPKYQEWCLLITQLNSGNQYAFSRLFDMYLRLVVKIALRFYKETRFELDDAIQEGSRGLIRAIQQYDGSKHGNLGSYIPLWIQQYISRAVADKSRTIRLPVHVYEVVQRLIRSQNYLFEKLGRKPSYIEIALDLELTVETIMKLIETTQEPISLEKLLHSKENEEYVFKYFSIPSFEKESIDNISAKMVRESLLILNERERLVLALRYGLFDGRGRTLEEIGVYINLTRERIRQIESKALRKLYYSTRSKYIKDLF